MKWILGLAFLAACSDTQNLGDSFTFHGPRWGLSIEPSAEPWTPQAAANGVVIDRAGDVIAVGAYNNSINFGTTTLVSDQQQGAAAFWVGKRSGIDGSEKWTLGFQGDNLGVGALAVDAQRNVFIAGSMGDSYDFGGQTLQGYGDAFVAKYDPDGALVWASGLGQQSDAGVGSIAVSPTGQIFIEAYVSRYLRSPQGPTLGQGNVIASYDAGGTLLWAYALPFAMGVAATSDGGFVLGGVARETTMLGGTKIDLTKDGSCVVAKLDANGHFEWVHTFGEPGTGYSYLRFAVDSADRVAAVASSQNEMPTEVLMDASGVLWTAQAPEGAASAYAIATYQDLVLTGGMSGDPVDFGSGKVIGSVYLSARDANGAIVDAKVYGDPTRGSVWIHSLATGPNGEIAFAGSTQQPIDLGNGPLPGPTTVDGSNPASNLMIGIIDAP
jgi:hypothetical protein